MVRFKLFPMGYVTTNKNVYTKIILLLVWYFDIKTVMKEAHFNFLYNNSILMIGNLDRERKNFSFISPAVKMLNELPKVALVVKCHITFYTITQEDNIFT